MNDSKDDVKEQEAETILEMVEIDKRFKGVHALKKCSLNLRRGEVLALVGENGAGKSTLMNILTGNYQEYGGQIIYNGERVAFKSAKDAQVAGISIVHQELNLMNHLTVAQNIFMGRESNGFLINDKELVVKARKILENLNLHVSPTEKVSNLTVGKAQMVEIAKAISFDCKVLVLDEPTAALSEGEVNELFNIVRDLQQKGVSVIFISHRMEEIKQIANRVTVMRDGETVKTLDVAACSLEEIIKHMVGRVIYVQPKEKSAVPKDAPVVLEARHLCSPVVKDVSFTLRKGEILGFAGLIGAGRTEAVRLVYGADKMDSGEIFINGKKVEIHSPVDAVANGIGYLSEDRRRFGLATGLSVIDNMMLPNLDTYSKLGLFVKDRACGKVADQFIQDLDIKTPTSRQLVRNLSGGNQQKVVISKWLVRNSSILIFDEPTRGIDVGAKNEIYKLMERLIEQGKSIIMISSELPEVLRMSDRVIVMCEGRKTMELDISEANQETIMKYATNRGVENYA